LETEEKKHNGHCSVLVQGEERVAVEKNGPEEVLHYRNTRGTGNHKAGDKDLQTTERMKKGGEIFRGLSRDQAGGGGRLQAGRSNGCKGNK